MLPTISRSNGAKGKPRKEIKNVVIFGETGVGKSSLINLVAGERISETSSSAAGCTLDYRCYPLKLGDQRFAIWDTAGLDEGTQGTVPAEKAEAYLKQLLRDLAKASGIDLLIYCVRGTRVRSALLTNYHLFYSAICRKKVPIAIVITGLENQEGNMGTWWLKNEKQFSALQMHFDNYACVTTLESSTENATLKERRRISKAALIKMITSTCRTEQWMPAERSWANTAFSDIRTILSPRNGHGVQVANVIMCDVSRYAPVGQATTKRVTFHNPVTLSLSFVRPMGFRSPVLVVYEKSQSKFPFDNAMKCTPERLFRVYQVPRKQTPSRDKEEEMKKDMVVKRGADLLIFCVKKEDGERRDVKLQWEHFNLTYGGDLSPQLIVIIGATDQWSAEEWWNDAVGGAAIAMPGGPSIAYWPTNMSIAEARVAKGRLQDLINTCCIDCSKVNFAEDKQIFRRNTSPRLDKNLIPLWMRPRARNTSKVDVPVAHQDVLTEWGVWEHIPVERNTVTISHTISPSRTFTSRDDEERNPFRPSLSS
ncbi:hypothetical protein J3R83DRAFT_3724 [Lanmaoa asiatica]|nr:hypothetical protein J3R83DRAFT_3724 [Lanmaoa asiatica]